MSARCRAPSPTDSISPATTAANLSQVFGLFSDPAGETDGIFDTYVAGEPCSPPQMPRAC